MSQGPKLYLLNDELDDIAEPVRPITDVAHQSINKIPKQTTRDTLMMYFLTMRTPADLIALGEIFNRFEYIADDVPDIKVEFYRTTQRISYDFTDVFYKMTHDEQFLYIFNSVNLKRSIVGLFVRNIKVRLNIDLEWGHVYQLHRADETHPPTKIPRQPLQFICEHLMPHPNYKIDVLYNSKNKCYEIQTDNRWILIQQELDKKEEINLQSFVIESAKPFNYAMKVLIEYESIVLPKDLSTALNEIFKNKLQISKVDNLYEITRNISTRSICKKTINRI